MTLKDEYDLNLPEASDFISEEPKISMNEMIAICEAMLPHWNKIRYAKPDPKFIGEVFVLLDEDKKV